jgi:hypothetical protein
MLAVDEGRGLGTRQSLRGRSLDKRPSNDELQRTRDGNAAASPLNSVLGVHTRRIGIEDDY